MARTIPTEGEETGGDGDLRTKVLLEAFQLLQKAFGDLPHMKAILTTPHLLDLLLGLFERNNIDIAVQSSCKAVISEHLAAQEGHSSSSSNHQLSTEEEALWKRILIEKEVAFQIGWSNDATQNFQDEWVQGTQEEDHSMEEEDHDDDVQNT
eukprot:Platyproteum_vivax@DN6211_c0_g1_i1.p2